MTVVQGDYHPRTISQYVPLMEFAANVVGGQVLTNLGTPSTRDVNGILAAATIGADSSTTYSFTSSSWATTFDGSSTHVGESVAGKLNCKFGRALIVYGDASTDQVVTITGRDYLGAIMSEALTLSGTVEIFGKKAFMYVDTVAVSASSGGSALNVGWTDRLGLPYKSEKIVSYTEDDVSFPVDVVEVPIEVPGTEYAAGTDVFTVSPIAGQVTGYQSVLTTAAASADNVNTVFVGSSAVNVGGLTITHTNPTAVGIQDSDTATTDDDQATSRVDKYEAIGISGDGGGSGAAHYTITVEPLTFIAGDETTATTSTNDTRGTILVTTPCDASIEYEVTYTCDTTNLHGLVQA